MSQQSNFSSTQKIPQALQLNKLTKVSSGYLEISAFKDSDHYKDIFDIIVYIGLTQCAENV